MNDSLGFIILGIVIVLFLADRYLQTRQVSKKEDRLLEELSRTNKALISKNANDYVMTASIDKVATEDKPPKDPDEIPEEALSDDQFFDAIQKANKK